MSKNFSSSVRLEKHHTMPRSVRSSSNEPDMNAKHDLHANRMSALYLHSPQTAKLDAHIARGAIRQLSHQVGNQAVQRDILQRQKEEEGWLNKIKKEGLELLSNPVAYPGKKAKSAKSWMKKKAKEKYKGAKKWLKDLF